jgi:hypothetical protein
MGEHLKGRVLLVEDEPVLRKLISEYWTTLSEDERNDIANKLIAALNSIGIKGTTARWNVHTRSPRWQLTIESPWCANKSRSGVSRALEQAMARTDIQAPINGVILKSSPKK